MNDAAVKEILTKLSEYGLDSTTAPLHVPDFIRNIGWAIVKFLGSIVDALYVGIAKICEALDFAKSDGLQELVQSYSFILQALFIVTLVGTGLYFLAKKPDTQTSIALNLVIMIIVLTSMPLITSQFSTLTSAGVNGFLEKGAKTYQGEVAANYHATGGSSSNSGSSAESITSVLIANNMVDLLEVDKNISGNGKVSGLAKGKGYINRSSILDGNWKKIKISSAMDYDHGNLKNDDIWDQMLTQPELGTGSDLGDMDGFFDSLNDYYYRWQVVSWFNIFANLLIMFVVLFFVSLKCATLIFGIAAAQIYMPFIAATDLVIGQRIKAAIRNFISLFGALLLCVALMGLYFVGFSYIESQNFGLSGIALTFVRIVLQLALAWMVINGPDIIEQIIGIDVGLRSGWQAVMGLRAAGQVVSGAGRAVSHAGRSVAKAGGFAADKVFGRKTAPAMPPGDGKRHGGIKGAITGENAELKNFAQQEREKSLNSASYGGSKAGSASPTAAKSSDDSPGKTNSSDSNLRGSSTNQEHPSPASSAEAAGKAGNSNLQSKSLDKNKTGTNNATDIPVNANRKEASPSEAQFGRQENLHQSNTPGQRTDTAKSSGNNSEVPSAPGSPGSFVKNTPVSPVESGSSEPPKARTQERNQSPSMTHNSIRQSSETVKPARSTQNRNPKKK